jgi:hypothetical protein
MIFGGAHHGSSQFLFTIDSFPKWYVQLSSAQLFQSQFPQVVRTRSSSAQLSCFKGPAFTMWDGEIKMTFANLEKREAEKSSKSLMDIENKLYSPLAKEATPRAPEADAGDPYNRRYYSEGYEANYEGVEDEEIRQWQGAFQYLRVAGCRVPGGGGLAGDGFADAGADTDGFIRRAEVDSRYFVEGLPSGAGWVEDSTGLLLCGHAATLHPPVHSYAARGAVDGAGGEGWPQEDAEEGEGEYLARQGLLEEYIEYHTDPLGAHAGDETTASEAGMGLGAVEPGASKREEVVCAMADTLWPDVVTAMQPLIVKVLAAAKEGNIPHQIERERDEESRPALAAGFDFASDDGW